MAKVAQKEPGLGHNTQAPDYGQRVAEQIARDYEELTKSTADLLAEARDLPKVIDDEPTLGKFASLIKRMRDTTGRIEAFQVKEKEPYLRGGQAVDSFFFGLWEKLARRNKNNTPGAADILQARVNDYANRKADEERRRREEEARIAREEAERLRKIEEEERRKAAEAAAAADRARKAENIQQHERLAEHHTAVANETQIDARLAAMKANEASAATIVKTADIVRTRFDDGAMLTARQVPVVEIIDRTKLSRELLWPFLKEEHILSALKAWAKTNGHKTPMEGALIEMRDEAVIR